MWSGEIVVRDMEMEQELRKHCLRLRENYGWRTVGKTVHVRYRLDSTRNLTVGTVRYGGYEREFMLSALAESHVSSSVLEHLITATAREIFKVVHVARRLQGWCPCADLLSTLGWVPQLSCIVCAGTGKPRERFSPHADVMTSSGWRKI